MGLIKAALGAAGGTMADQWKEFFYCESIPNDLLMVKGQKRTSGRSSNTKGSDNIISNGSGIAVADGQCMIIVEQGKIVEVCAEPGEFIFDSSTEPSIFSGSLGQGIINTFKTIGKRFTYGGDTGKDQRVYYFNTKEIGDNLFGTATPIPFRVIINEALGYKMSVDIRCNGEYSYKIVDPILFYTNVCGNVESSYARSKIDVRLKSELMNALQPALAKLSANKIEYYELPAHTMEISDALNEVLSKQWTETRGIKIFSFNINSLSIPDDQRKKITEWEENAMTTDPSTAAARLVGAQSEAMKTAAGNEAGAMAGFMGMGMAMNMGGNNAQNLYAMGQQQQAQQPAPQQAAPQQSAPADGWACECGSKNTGKFCINCGKPKPDADSWACECGTQNTGKFCMNCGKPKPAAKPKCSNCGWEPPAGTDAPKFCPECGHNF